MLKFRTTKEVAISLQDDSKSLLEFRYKFKAFIDESIEITVDVYSVKDDEINLIGGGGSKRIYSKEELDTLIENAKTITPDNDNPLEYVYDLMRSGIKLVIVAESLWKGILTLNDFE